MIGIILAGGEGSRLFPITQVVNKHLLPIYDKPVIYYSIATLMQAGIKRIYLVIRNADYSSYFRLLGNGSSFGISIQYVYQNESLGIADALLRCKNKVKGKFVVLLGDNFLYGGNVKDVLIQEMNNFRNGEMTIFNINISNPNIATSALFSNKDELLDFEFKVNKGAKNVCPGLYFYDDEVFDRIDKLFPSKRNELEIIDLNKEYLKENKVRLVKFSAETIWMDLGTKEYRLIATNFVHQIQFIHGKSIACLEEIGYKNGWITKEQIKKNIRNKEENEYYVHLQNTIELEEGV